jgi:hypothetical protein
MPLALGARRYEEYGDRLFLGGGTTYSRVMCQKQVQVIRLYIIKATLDNVKRSMYALYQYPEYIYLRVKRIVLACEYQLCEA